jgi:hypothetical protein
LSGWSSLRDPPIPLGINVIGHDIQEIEEKVLDIEKAALVPHLSWNFSDEGSAQL